MDKIIKLIQIIHNIKEEAPTVSIASGGIDGIKPGETPPVYKKNYAKGGKGSRKWWLQFLKGK